MIKLLFQEPDAGLHHLPHVAGAGPSLSQQALNTGDLEDKKSHWPLCPLGEKVAKEELHIIMAKNSVRG